MVSRKNIRRKHLHVHTGSKDTHFFQSKLNINDTCMGDGQRASAQAGQAMRKENNGAPFFNPAPGMAFIQRDCLTQKPDADESLYVYTSGKKKIAATFTDSAGAIAFINKHPNLPLRCLFHKGVYGVYIRTQEEKTKKEEKPKEEEKPREEAADSSPIVFALTFDDGPHVAELGKGTNLTEMVLDTLDSKGSIKAGFFIQTGIGYRGAHKNGKKLVARMDKDGHVIGIHTGGTEIDHELHTASEKKGTLEAELNAAKQYVTDNTKQKAVYVRPPTGAYNAAVTAIYNKVGLTNLMWDIDGDGGATLPTAELDKKLETGMENMKKRNWKPGTGSSKIIVLSMETKLI